MREFTVLGELYSYNRPIKTIVGCQCNVRVWHTFMLALAGHPSCLTGHTSLPATIPA